MKTNQLIDELLMISAALLVSCSPVIYSNVGTNTPMFTEKGEVAINGSYASTTVSGDVFYTTTTSGVGLQGAYAIDDHWAAIGSFYSLKNREEPNDDYNWIGKGTYWELGGGRYGTIGSKKLFAYEIFGGFGSASIKNEDYLNRSNYLNINFSKPFIQPSIGFIFKYVDLIFTPRFGYVIFSNPSYNLIGGEPNYELPKDSFIFEPGFTLRAGFKGVKLQLQYNFSNYKYSNIEEMQAGVNDMYASFGLHVLISDRYKK